MKKVNWKKMLVSIGVVVVLLVFFAISAIAAGEQEQVVYTVKQGDTLGELMYAWRVQGVEIEKLYSWNPGLGTQVKIGQEITYYLPDRQDVISEQEVKKIISEVKDGLIAQKVLIDQTGRMLESAKADIEAAKVPVPAPVAPVAVSYLDEILWHLKTGFSAALVILIPIFAYFYFKRERAKAANTKPAKFKLWHQFVFLTVNGKRYKFFPEITADRKQFVALHKIKGQPMLIKSQEDLEKSVIWSLKQNPGLIVELLKSGRLTEMK